MTKRLTTEECVRRCREVLPQYDYSKVKYVNNSTKIDVICPKHGAFKQYPSALYNGIGCPSCGYEKRKNRGSMTNEEWIKRAEEKHGKKYDYSRVIYKGHDGKVWIGCPIHGWFEQEAGVHLQGFGCQKCGKNYKPTNEEFIIQSKKLYPNKIKYDKCNYVNSKTNVVLYCTEKDENGEEHGYYKVNPNNHLRGTYGCKKCQYQNLGKKSKEKKVTKLIQDSKEKFGEQFLYDNIADEKNGYKFYCTKKDENGIEHGFFTVNYPYDHLHKKNGGCPKCHTHQHTTESWKERAKIVHGDTYDYSKTDLENRDEKGRVLITCRIHGDFWQDPANHLQGMGCQCCTRGITKQYKFNLLDEFESEYDLRAFLEKGDINILYILLSNLEPKFDPLKKDFEKALGDSEAIDPLKALKDKYSSDSDDELDVETINGSSDEFAAATAPIIDLDDDDAIDALVGTKVAEEKEPPTIEELIKDTEREIKVINKIEHLLTPEVRKYIVDKFTNDMYRLWMEKRETVPSV